MLEVLAAAFPRSRPDTRAALARGADVQVFEAGQTIIQQGNESSIAFILDGHAAARRTTVDGRQLIVAVVGRGRLASFLPLAGRPTAADIVALTPTPAALWRAEEVRSLATADPGLAVDALDHILATFEAAVGRLDSLLYQDAPRRVARMLSVYANLFFAEQPVLTRAHLPALVGTSREMTGRVLRVLESRGLVARVGRDRLRLLDPAGLEAAAEATVHAPGRVQKGPEQVPRHELRGGAIVEPEHRDYPPRFDRG